MTDVAIGGDTRIIEQVLGVTGDTFGMTDIKMTTFRQQACKTRPDAHLRRLVEIDDDVAAEDDVEIALEGPLRHQVQFIEGDEALDLVVDLELAAAASIHFREPLLAHGGRHGFERIIVIDPGTGLRQYFRSISVARILKS